MKKLMMIATLVLTTALVASAQVDDRVQTVVDGVDTDYPGKWGADSVEAIKQYSLYREYYKQEAYSDALPGWRYILANAPKASLNVAINGTKMYEALAEEAEEAGDTALALAYIDTALAMYEVRGMAHGWDGNLYMRKAFAWYQHRNDDIELVYDMFTTAYDERDESMRPAFIAPWIIMAIKADKNAKIIDDVEVLNVYDRASAMAKAYSENGDAGQWKGASDKAFEYLERYGYLDCDKVLPRAETMYQSADGDEATLRKVYSWLRATGAECYEEVPYFCELVQQLYDIEPTVPRAKFLSNCYASENDYDRAINMIDDLMGFEETTEEEQAILMLSKARMYKYKGQFSTARTLANQAADMRPNWGDPYMLIGELYIASAGSCKDEDPFLGWAVSWAAVDMFARAKSVDPSVAEKAQSAINKYSAYFPPKEEGFFRDIMPGASYTVGCWIQHTTTARFKD